LMSSSNPFMTESTTMSAITPMAIPATERPDVKLMKPWLFFERRYFLATRYSNLRATLLFAAGGTG
jgi:hypothetical protein